MNERAINNPGDTAQLPEASQPSYTERVGERGEAMTSPAGDLRTGRARSLREPVARAERIQIAMFAALVAMFAAMLGAGVVGFTAISGQLLDMQEQIGGLRAEMHDEIGQLRAEIHEEIGQLRAEVHEEIGQLRAEMKDQFGELSDRIARIETVLQIQHGPLPGP